MTADCHQRLNHLVRNDGVEKRQQKELIDGENSADVY
jgi:hypothetical protein